ncbi:hypothetical protein KSS87_019450, partial [Heliosperma pusillum]
TTLTSPPPFSKPNHPSHHLTPLTPNDPMSRAGLRRRTQAPKPIYNSQPPPPTIILLDSDSDSDSDSDYNCVRCEECKSGENAAKLLLCDDCDRGFHLYCLKPILAKVPKGDWSCPLCSASNNVKKFPLIQTKIVDFFRIQKPANEVQTSISGR